MKAKFVGEVEDFMSKSAEIERLRDTISRYEGDYRAAATEFRVPIPEPGTDAAKLLTDAMVSRKLAADLVIENEDLRMQVDKLLVEIAWCRNNAR